MIQSSLLLLAMCFYLASLTQRAFVIRGKDVWRGWAALVFGVLGVGAGEYANWVWLANPLLFMAWCYHGRPLPSIVLATASLLLALSFKFCSKVTVSEADGKGYAITATGLGYWLWSVAIAITFVAMLSAVFL